MSDDRVICVRCNIEFTTCINRYSKNKSKYKECTTCRSTRIRKIKQEPLNYDAVETYETNTLYASISGDDKIVLMYMTDTNNIELYFQHKENQITLNTDTVPKNREFMILESIPPHRRIHMVKTYFKKLRIRTE